MRGIGKPCRIAASENRLVNDRVHLQRPDSMSTLQTILQIIATELDLDPASLDAGRPLEEIGIDSLTVMECLFKIEDEFKISVAGSNAAVRTLQDISDMVDGLLASKAAEVS